MRNGRKRNGYNGNGSVLNAGTFINVLSIPIITVGLTLVGWYFTTNVTMQKNIDDISKLQMSREADKKEFGSKFDTMNAALATLNTHAAVQDETLKEIRDRLTPHDALSRH